MSGSNCGDIFIYDKNTEDVVQWLSLYDQFMSRRDYEICHVVGHPHIPILAAKYGTSVRIWSPSSRESPTQSKFRNKEIKTLCERNLRRQRLLSLRPELSL
ncbi:PREDICTED: uncharacterized protein LOC108764732 [Trachymyrmex cornetzi]|uniref:uncharacterized protein LOC108764732 n=1 Tax=Trachymyrmex cornetzi TaxID=471704 RepID=UPI00084F3CFE|nr:PREDICTED: uncharacterized protein LOC108764732 [Trachymyrmex cornetzi]